MSAHGGKLRALPASDGKPVNHDGSATAEEAAPHVVRARTPGGPASAALPPPMTAAEALAEAEAEGLTLVRSSSSQSGFLNVCMSAGSKVRPYQANEWRDAKVVHLGSLP